MWFLGIVESAVLFVNFFESVIATWDHLWTVKCLVFICFVCLRQFKPFAYFSHTIVIVSYIIDGNVTSISIWGCSWDGWLDSIFSMFRYIFMLDFVRLLEQTIYISWCLDGLNVLMGHVCYACVWLQLFLFFFLHSWWIILVVRICNAADVTILGFSLRLTIFISVVCDYVRVLEMVRWTWWFKGP